MTEWIAVGIAALSLVVSLLSLLRGRPRIRVTGQVALVFDKTRAESRFVVTVTNSGGAAARVRRVLLRGTDGGFVHAIGTDDSGPSLPFELAPFGGHSSWSVSYEKLRNGIAESLRDSPLAVRATVVVGNRNYKQRGFVGIPPKGEVTAPRPLMERLRFRWRRWTHPSLVHTPFTNVDDVNLDDRSVALAFTNSGLWFTRPRKLRLVLETADHKRSFVPGVGAVQVRRVPPGRTVSLAVPLVDDLGSPDGASFWWHVTTSKGAGLGYGAMTLQQAKELVEAQIQWNREHPEQARVIQPSSLGAEFRPHARGPYQEPTAEPERG